MQIYDSAPRGTSSILSFTILLPLLVLVAPDQSSAQLVREGSQQRFQSDFLLDSDPDDHFGSVFARGDFDCDGFDDAAFGIPESDLLGAHTNAGKLLVVYGSEYGLTVAHTQTWTQAAGGVADTPEDYDGFGTSLAVGDFDGDECDDLAVGVPGETYFWSGQNRFQAGAVAVLFGSPGSGLTSLGSQFWRAGHDGLLGSPATGDRFGQTLVAGDFDGNQVDDLAIAAPYDTADAVADAGSVHVLYGIDGVGLAATDNQLWDQGDIDGSASEPDDAFGLTLAAGDFDDDGDDELVIGVPNEDIDAIVDAGALFVLRGTVNGLTHFTSQFWHEDSLGVPGVPYEDEYFAAALAVADFDGDGTEDLAVGVPGEPVFDDGGTPFHGIGRVRVFWGDDGIGLKATGMTSFNGHGLTGGLSQFERFGTSLVAGDFDRDGKADLAIGGPDAAVGAVHDAGATYVASGRGDRTFALQVVLDQGVGVPGLPATDDELGVALVAGDFDGDGDDDLVAGNPTDGFEDTGSVAIFESIAALFSDGFESGDSNGWSDTVVE